MIISTKTKTTTVMMMIMRKIISLIVVIEMIIHDHNDGTGIDKNIDNDGINVDNNKDGAIMLTMIADLIRENVLSQMIVRKCHQL